MLKAILIKHQEEKPESVNTDYNSSLIRLVDLSIVILTEKKDIEFKSETIISIEFKNQNWVYTINN